MWQEKQIVDVLKGSSNEDSWRANSAAAVAAARPRGAAGCGGLTSTLPWFLSAISEAKLVAGDEVLVVGRLYWLHQSVSVPL